LNSGDVFTSHQWFPILVRSLDPRVDHFQPPKRSPAHLDDLYLWLSSPTAWTKAPAAADTLTETPRTGMKERWRSPGGGESWLRHAVRQRVHHSACKNM